MSKSLYIAVIPDKHGHTINFSLINAFLIDLIPKTVFLIWWFGCASRVHIGLNLLESAIGFIDKTIG